MKMTNTVGVMLVIAAMAGCAPKREDQTGVSGPTAQEAAAAAFRGVAGDTNAQVEKFFDGPGGLLGLVVRSPDGTQDIAWATPDGSHIIIGAVVDGRGLNHTAKFAADLNLANLGPRTAVRNADGSVSVSEADAKRVQDLVVETSGEGSKEVYAIVDPLCFHCRNSYAAMREEAAQKSLKVHWILVATIGGQHSEFLTENYRTKKMSLEQIMNADRNAPAMSPASPDTMGYLNQSYGVLEGVVRQAAVPAIVYQEDGAWKARVGFSPAQFVASK